VVVSQNRLAAYVVPAASPAEGPDPLLTTATLRALLAVARVTSGLLDDVIDAFGDGAALSHIRCVSLGRPLTHPVDGRLEYHFEVDPRPTPRQLADGSVDHHALLVQRFVTQGAPLATRHPSVPGVVALDVFGVATEPPPPKDVDLKQVVGANVALQGDVIAASIAGRPVLSSRGAIDVLPVFEVPGDLDYGIGNVDFPGDVVIRGDVKPGFTISAGGSVVVHGVVEGASITAGQDLSVLGTVGERISVFKVAGDLTARYLHTTEAHVGGTIVVAGEIVNCTLDAVRVVTAPQGRIVGGHVTAEYEVDAGILGSRRENATHVTVTSRTPAAVVRARRAARPGLVITVGTARRAIEEELQPASFWSVGGSVVALLPGAETSFFGTNASAAA
jgi:uncharacterized protein (DUF342 family)